MADIAGITLYLQPVQDLTIDTETGLTPYRFSLHGASQTLVDQWGRKLAARLGEEPALADVNAVSLGQGRAVMVDINRDAAARLGVPEILVPDNLKSGVTRPCRYEPDINRTYEEMAAHYGVAVVPARRQKPRDKAKVEAVLKGTGLTPALTIGGSVYSPQANARMVVVNGQVFQEGNALTPEAAANMAAAVRDGLNYLGICAGAFIAGNSPYNGLNLTEGKQFGFYTLESQGFRKSAVWITATDGSRSEQYWEDGPELSAWGEPIATYPDGTPAAVQGKAGGGWVVLVGTHPEAPESWRRGIMVRTPARDSNDFARMVIETALNGPAPKTQ